jgi:hypothetical protein
VQFPELTLKLAQTQAQAQMQALPVRLRAEG